VKYYSNILPRRGAGRQDNLPAGGQQVVGPVWLAHYRPAGYLRPDGRRAGPCVRRRAHQNVGESLFDYVTTLWTRVICPTACQCGDGVRPERSPELVRSRPASFCW